MIESATKTNALVMDKVNYPFTESLLENYFKLKLLEEMILNASNKSVKLITNSTASLMILLESLTKLTLKEFKLVLELLKSALN